MQLLKRISEQLFPGYFALVMATGVLSIGTHLLELDLVAEALYIFNILAFFILWILTIIKLIYFRDVIKSEIKNHRLAPSYFTLIAGTSVFGCQVLMIGEHVNIALFLWFFAIILWLIIMYTFFTVMTVHPEKPAISKGINGAWLIAVVATQSLAVLGSFLSSDFADFHVLMLFFSICMYFLGCMLYLNIMIFIFYRFMFVELKFTAMAPPYWINMGAVAITTLAGANLILQQAQWGFLAELSTFLKGFTLFFWVTGTWWIPLLIILSVWRYVYHRDKPGYDPQLWAMVFPVSMYMTGTYKLAEALDLSFLFYIPKVIIYAALIIWICVFWGMITQLYRKLRRKIS